MAATKITLLFNAGTLDAAGQPARSAGFSESYYSTLPYNENALFLQWSQLCIARAGIMPAGVRICGSRYQTVDPIGGTRSYDNVYAPALTQGNDLPGIAFQWTVRSPDSPNQRSLILRGVPDLRVERGEYSPSQQYNNALMNFFNELRANWKFRCINRVVLPTKIVSITGGIMTTATPHGLAPNDTVRIMSTLVGTDPPLPETYEAKVSAIAGLTATLFRPGVHAGVPDSIHGKARKVEILYKPFSISNEEIVNPTAIHRKVGSPFRRFRGARTRRH
jgi:hypothetical protein